MKKIISILICIQLALFPAFAFASNVGGWTLGGSVAQGASTVYTGTKNLIINGKAYIKTGTAIITPTATGVAKVLVRVGGGYALSVAVEQLLGAVDWVLDPANNQIVYTQQNDPDSPPKPTDIVGYQGLNYCTSKTQLFSSEQSANNFICNHADCSTRPAQTAIVVSSTSIKCTEGFTMPRAAAVANPDYDPQAKPDEEQKTLPLDVVAQQVISNAESGDAQAQAVTTSAAADIVAEAEKDDAKARPIVDQLEQSATTKPADDSASDQAGTATGETTTTNPQTGETTTTDLKLEFPIFCDWAPTVCEAAQTVISFPKTLTGWWNTTNQKADSWALSISDAWTSVKDWATGAPDLKQDETDLPIEDKTLDRDPSSFDTDYIVLGSQCPTFEPYTVEVGPVSKTLSMDLIPLCQFAEKVRPAILGMAYFTAAGIVVAAIRET